MYCKSGSDITANGMVLRQQCVLLPVDVASSQQEETLAERKKEGGRYKGGRRRKSKEQLSDVPVIYLSSGTMYLFHFLLLLLLLSLCPAAVNLFLLFRCPLNWLTFSEKDTVAVNKRKKTQIVPICVPRCCSIQVDIQ